MLSNQAMPLPPTISVCAIFLTTMVMLNNAFNALGDTIHVAFFHDPGARRPTMAPMFVGLTVAAAWLVSLATLTRHGALRMPSGQPAPSPLMNQSSRDWVRPSCMYFSNNV